MNIEAELHRQGAALRREKDAWDVDAFMARLTRRITAGQQARDAPDRPHRAPVTAGPGPARPARRGATGAPPDQGRVEPPVFSHEEELLRLCEDTVTTPDVKALLEQFLADFEPSGARVFACLLYLAGHAEQALFWWRFASGGEDGLAAHCLILHSRATRAVRMVRTWTMYARASHFDPELHWPQPDRRWNTPLDAHRISVYVQAHIRIALTDDESEPTILLPTSGLPAELVSP